MELKPELTFHRFGDKSLEAVLGLRAPPFSSGDEAFRQLRYVERYAADLKCETFAVESHYIDRDHIEDHSVFYSKTLFPYTNYCRRIHFFSVSIDDVKSRLSDIVALGLSKGEAAYRAACRDFSSDAYIGFAVIKPLHGSPVGRTVLRCSPEASGKPEFRRVFSCTRQYSAHLAGVELTVRGLAFQQQDVGVSACATTAVWSALQQIQKHEGIANATPAQITTLAAKYSLPFGRAMPSEGLSLDQMCQAIQAIGVAPNLFRVEESGHLAGAFIYAAVTSGLAPVLILRSDKQYHAVTVAGIKVRTPHIELPVSFGTQEAIADDCSGDLLALYIHDDRRGPYLRADYHEKNVIPLLLIRGRGNDDADESWEITHVLVPMHAKIRLTFSSLRQISLDAAAKVNGYRDFVNGVNAGAIANSLVSIESWIVRAHRYVEQLFLSEHKVPQERVERLATGVALARYLAVVRLMSPFFGTIDLLIDTTGTKRNAHCIGVVPLTPDVPHSPLIARWLAKFYGGCPII